MCHPHNVTLPDEHCMVFYAHWTGQIKVLHRLQSRAFRIQVPLILTSMQVAPLATSAGPKEPQYAGPAHLAASGSLS